MNAYVKASEKPQAGWVSPALIDDRLEPEYYNPDYVALDAQLDNSGLPISALGNIAQTFTGPFGSNLPSSLYRQSGIPLLRVQNIGDFGINWNNLVFLDQPTHELLGDSRLITGDLALAKSGSFGKVAPIWPVYGECNITEHILGIRVTDPEIDPVFLAAFLASSYGLSQIKRKALGTILKYLGVQVSRSIKIPKADPKIQAYIGDKVRLAEKCRGEARENRTRIENLLDQYLQKVTVLFSKRSEPSHIIEANVVTDRLDAEFYQPRYLDLVQAIQASPYQKLGRLIHLPIKGIQPEYNPTGIVPALTGTNIDPYWLDIESASRVDGEWAKGKTKALAAPNEILFTVTGPPLGEAAVVHHFQCPLVVNSHVARIKPRENFNYPFYLAALLNSTIVSAQVYRYCKGVRQKELYPEDIMEFVIPKVDDEAVCEINNLGFTADILEYCASDLTRKAISDVERLIEGQMDSVGIISGKIKPPTYKDIQHQLNDINV